MITEQTTLLTELLTENVDVYVAPAPEQAATILEDPNLELRRFESRQYTFVGWNARRPQLSDARVQTARSRWAPTATRDRRRGGSGVRIRLAHGRCPRTTGRTTRP